MTLTVLRFFLTESSSSLELLELLEPLVERWFGLGLILGPAGTNITYRVRWDRIGSMTSCMLRSNRIRSKSELFLCFHRSLGDTEWPGLK